MRGISLMSRKRLEVTYKQVKSLLQFFNPPEECGEEDEIVVVQYYEEGQVRDDNGEGMPAGLYAYYEEHPDEGCSPL